MLVKVKEGYTLCVGPKMVPPGTELDIPEEVYVTQSWKCIRLATPVVATPPMEQEKEPEEVNEESKEEVEEKQITKSKNRAMVKARTRVIE